MYNFRGIYSENTYSQVNEMQSPVFIARSKSPSTGTTSKASSSKNNSDSSPSNNTDNSRNNNESVIRTSMLDEVLPCINIQTTSCEDVIEARETLKYKDETGQEVRASSSNSFGEAHRMLPDVLTNDESGIGRIRTLTLAKPEIEDINIGFNLTRSQWDPYPWVKCVDKDTCAERAGLHEGDCLIKVGDEDLLGLKISDVAGLVRSQRKEVTLLVWSAGSAKDGDSDSLLLGPLPLALTRLSSCLASVLRAAECPVCARTIPAPAHQCPSGHLLCATCRSRMEYCPLCRAALGRCRNLLADEVYNCVLENFDLRPDKRERLTKTLFGEDAKFIENHGNKRSVGNNQDSSRQAKWGTQKLLDRLLPSRARSTGNIARIGTRNRTLVENDRDVSRSLSTLDINRCSREVSPCHSLPATAAGSCDSLPNARYTVDQNEISNRAARQDSVIRYNCPVDSSCRGTIAGDVQSHIILSHDIEVLLKSSEGHIKLGNSNGYLVSLLHRSGLWFFPKYYRDERNKGIKIWCWVVATSEISSKYQMNVEVHRSKNNVTHINGMSGIVNENRLEQNGNTEVIVSAVVHHEKPKKKKLSSGNKIDNSSMDEITTEHVKEHDKLGSKKESIDGDDGICILMEDCFQDCSNKNSYIDAVNVECQIKEPILKFSAPVLSLVECSWNDVLNSGNKSVFLSDYIVLNDHVDIVASIEEVN